MVIRIFTFLIFCIFLFLVADAQHARTVKAGHKTAKKTNTVLINGDTLIVNLKNGKIKRFINKQHEDETYSFQGSIEQAQYLLFHYRCRFGEVEGFLVVNKINGSQCDVPGKPLLSPNNKRFVTSCVDLEAQYNPNFLAIYRMDKDSCRVEYSIEPADWGAAKVKWLNNISIEYQKVVKIETEENVAGRYILHFKNNYWQLK